jgi:hypothetical protein
MQMLSCFVHLVIYNTLEKTEFKMDIIWMRLIILKILYFVVVMWQLIWTICMLKEFTSVFLLYSYKEFGRDAL